MIEDADSVENQFRGCSTQLRNDLDNYKELQITLTNLALTGQIDTPEFQAAWKASEEIKNRNGGMPPNELES